MHAAMKSRALAALIVALAPAACGDKSEVANSPTEAEKAKARFTALKAALSVPVPPAIARVESPCGGSTLMTRAPMSASNIAQ